MGVRDGGWGSDIWWCTSWSTFWGLLRHRWNWRSRPCSPHEPRVPQHGSGQTLVTRFRLMSRYSCRSAWCIVDDVDSHPMVVGRVHLALSNECPSTRSYPARTASETPAGDNIPWAVRSCASSFTYKTLEACDSAPLSSSPSHSVLLAGYRVRYGVPAPVII